MTQSSFIVPWRARHQCTSVTWRPSTTSTRIQTLYPLMSRITAVETSTVTFYSTPTPDVEVLSSQDIVIGTILAFILAFGYSYLNGQSSSTNFVSWRSGPQQPSYPDDTFDSTTFDTAEVNTTVFNETNWKEMSRAENYILHNSRIRDKQFGMQKTSSNTPHNNNNNNRKENKAILMALLALFLPIFSIEIFFALSRQFLCEGSLFHGDLAERLCSPVSR